MGFASSKAVLMLAFVHLLYSVGHGSVILIGKNVRRPFTDTEASFTPRLKSTAISGVLYLAEPLDACSPLTNLPVQGAQLPFVLIIRGGCSFEDKVRNAQGAGFKAAVVYDDKESGVLVSMSGSSRGISIYAVFVSKASGEVLKEYAGNDHMKLWIIPSYRNSPWSIMMLSIISLLTMSAVLAACFFVRRYWIRREQPRIRPVKEFHGMSSQLVKAMPTLIFAAVKEDSCTSATCAICLEDYSVGDKLRVLPCGHKFHASCVDSWLTAWRSFCPVCKRDASTTVSPPPASEHTPLLSCPSPGTRQSSFSSSFSSSLATSAQIDIINLPGTPSLNLSRSPSLNLSRSPSVNLSRSLSSSWRQTSSNNSNMLSLCRSFTYSNPIYDLRNTSSPRYHISDLIGPSPACLLSLPISTRQLQSHINRRNNSSPSNPVGSSSRQSHQMSSSDSATTISGLASTDSLPEC